MNESSLYGKKYGFGHILFVNQCRETQSKGAALAFARIPIGFSGITNLSVFYWRQTVLAQFISSIFYSLLYSH